jgi:hypothetical protein
MLRWWSVVGADPAAVAAAVALLETAAIRVKNGVLGESAGSAPFNNRTLAGGGGQKKGVCCYHGYLLTVHRGELQL